MSAAYPRSECAALVFLLHPVSARQRAVAVLGAYFDESGTHENPVIFSFAGYLFTMKRIMRFEREWLEILRTFNVSAFHASDLEAGSEEFAGWSDQQCDALVEALVSIINRHALLGAAVAADTSRYAEFAAGIPSTVKGAYRTAFTDDAYVVSMYNCLRVIAEFHGQQCPGDEKIACIFDERKLKGTITELYEDAKKTQPWGKRLGAIAFADDTVATPLQAADLLAYTTRRNRIELMQGTKEFRPAYLRLRKKLHRIAFLDAQGAAELSRQLDALKKA